MLPFGSQPPSDANASAGENRHAKPVRLSAVARALCLATAALAGLLAARPQPAVAAPGGVFAVNSGADDTAFDGGLTLREAILVANGGTGAGGLNRSVSDAEKAQLVGCTFTQDLSALPFSAWLITGGCAAGGDTVRFDPAVTQVSLTDSLPNLTANGTKIQGLVPAGTSWVYPRIDGTAMTSTYCSDGFVIAANDVELSSLVILNLRPSSQLVNYSCADIVVVSGLRAVITQNYLGFPLLAAACNTGGITRNATYGVRILANGAGSQIDPIATISNTSIACHSRAGVWIENGANHVRVNQNTIGSDSLGHGLPNGIGVATAPRVGVTYTDDVLISGNTISGNLQDGIRLTAVTHAAANANVIGLTVDDGNGNRQPLGNGGSGLVFDDTGFSGVDANVILSAGTLSIVAANLGNGITISNSVGLQIGNPIGAVLTVGSPLMTADSPPKPALVCRPGWGNGGDGILIDSATTGAEVYPGTVGCNGRAGIATRNAGAGSRIVPGLVALNGGLPIDIGDDGPTRSSDPALTTFTLGSTPPLLSGSGCANCRTAVYVAIGNPATPGGGGLRVTAPSINNSAQGAWSLPLPGITASPWDAWVPNPALTSFAALAIDAGNNSYEITSRPLLYLPTLQK